MAVALSLADGLLGNAVAYERDTVVFYYPLMVWAAGWLHAGTVPLWAPQLFGGYPIFADGEIGLSYPPVLLALLALPPDRALIALRLLHLSIAALGTFALARAWRLPYAAATLAGVTFALGSFMQAEIHHENIARTAAWLPLALALCERALRATGRARLAWTALGSLVVGLESLSLHTQILVTDLLVLAAYGALRCWMGPIASISRRWWSRPVALLSVFPPVAGLGVAVGGVQLLPLAELARFSPRGGGITYADAASYSLTPYGLVQLIFPFVFRDGENHQWGLWTHWESYLYVGLVPLVLAAVAIARVRRREVWGWAGLAAVGIVLALGQYSPVNLHHALWLVPGLAGLRAPGRFSLVAVLALAMLAAYGLAWLQWPRIEPTRPRWRAWPFAAALLGPLLLVGALGGAHSWLLARPEEARALVAAWYLSLPRDSYALTASGVYAGLLWATDVANARAVGAVAGLLAIGLALAAWRSGPWAWVRVWPGWPAALVAAATLDLLVFGWSIHPREPLSVLAATPPAATVVRDRLASDAAQGQPARVLASPVLAQVAPNRLAPLSLQEANGYTSLESRWHSEYLRRVFSVDDDLLDLWNVRYVLEPARYGTLASYKGVSYLPQNPLLRGPAHNALADETFRVPAGFRLSELRVVAALVNAVDTPQDAPVGEILLKSASGEVLERRTLRAGRDVMDWAAENPNVSPKLQHQRVEVAGLAFETGRDGRQESRLLSYAHVSLDRPTTADAVEVRSLVSGGELVLYGAALVDPSGATSQLFGRQKSKYREIFRDREVAVLENTAAYPRAFLVDTARVAPSPGAALDVMARGPFDPRREVVLAGDTPPVLVAHVLSTATDLAPSLPRGDPADLGRAEVERYGLTDVVVRVSTPGDALLVLSDSYYPGWRAFVDGQERPLLRGDVLFRVVQVPSGSHTVEFRFEPSSVYAGLAVTLVALATLATMLAVALWPRRSTPKRSAPGVS